MEKLTKKMIITFFATVMMLLLIPAAAMAADYNCSSISKGTVLTSSDSLKADDGGYTIYVFPTQEDAQTSYTSGLAFYSKILSYGETYVPEKRYETLEGKQYNQLVFDHDDLGNLHFYVSNELPSPLIDSPQLKTDVTYNGDFQALLTKGANVKSGATAYYCVKELTDWATTFPEWKLAGTYTILMKVDGGTDYADIAKTEVGQVEIKKADATLKPVAASKCVGKETDPDFSFTAEGLKGSDTKESLNDITVSRAEGSDIGTYKMTVNLPDDPDRNPNYNLIASTDEVLFTITDHDWDFKASKNVITATCKNEGCMYHESGLTLTLTAPEDAVYNGDPWVATYGPNSFIKKTGGDPGSVVYKKDGSQVEKAIDPGKYTAEITIDNATAKVEFTIAKTDQKITSDDATMTVGDKDKKIEYTVEGLKDGPKCGDVTFEIKSGSDIISVDKDGKITAKKAGTAIVTITAAENDYYFAASKDVKVTVKEKSSKDKKDADSKSAKTGDNNRTGLWIGIIVAAIVVVAAALIISRRRKK